MDRLGPAHGIQQRLWLLLGILAVALSLLAMHQLSINHTAADPAAQQVHSSVTEHRSAHAHANDHTAGVAGTPKVAADVSSATADIMDARPQALGADHGQVLDGHVLDGQVLAGPVLAGVVLDELVPGDGACSDCAGHHTMMLTCLAALILLTIGWLLIRPSSWRTVRLDQHLSRTPVSLGYTWLPKTRSLVELAVCRT